ncbi:hypothetical protein K1T71_002403 [Dendrolimus kikuchii]|uniref:Uncharacterized protein n=1 Tax=Dendrolimus kikuchii TaxID=765133 RepID=A0ACC1DDJ6_9NEOP|nr:hypothetical protein K1T71_002403 [Dendrolimus kikuchii]
MELDVSPSEAEHNEMDYANNTSENKYITCNNNDQYSVIRIPEDGDKSSRHSSRKQSKRRKKSSNHSRPLPRIIVKPLPPPPPPETREWTAATSYVDNSSSSNRPSTMREVLASIPGFCIKPRKRSSKKLSTAAQLQQTREGCIDLETPDSILVNTNIRALLNKHTFSMLPPLYQYKLGQLLPSVDRLSLSGRLNSSSLNNEFFARACIEWQDSLSGGEFTPENQQKMKTEAEKEKSKIDPWKLKHFEPFWGEKSRKDKASINLNSDRPSLKTTIKLRPTASITSSSTVPKIKKSKSSSSSKRMRSVGAVTRSSAKADETKEETITISTKSSAPVPDLLPIKHIKSSNSQAYEELQVDCNFSDSSSIQRMDSSVSTTPVDPLLLPDVDTERNDLKQELDISVVTIEESNTSKECEEDKIIDSDSNMQECSKRLSDDNEDYTLIKRTRYEESVRYKERLQYDDEYALDNANFLAHNTEVLSNNCSDTEINYGNEQVCPNDDLIYSGQDHVDTNSEDSKATASVYEYDERSESSLSSLKIETNVNNAAVINDCSDNIDTPCEESVVAPEECSDVEITKNEAAKNSFENNDNEEYETEPNHVLIKETRDSDLDTSELSKTQECVKNEVPCQNYEVAKQEELQIQEPNEELYLQNSNSTDKSSPKCEVKGSPNQNVVQNYYDEHFKDAESFILETSLGILTPQNDEIRYTTHPLMELSSYMNETNVTAVVSMPLSQNSSIPMMEVTNTSIVSYPDDNMQDPAKPKNSAVSWKTNNDWSNNENVMTLHTFSTLNSDSTKYLTGDTKPNIEDVNMNDENCMYKEERDANYNMESSNSSESCHSMKETIKQEYEVATSLVSSTTVTNSSVNSTTMTQSVRSAGKKSKLGKDSSRSRSTNKVPPGAVNLERSYQICQAVIQNSPNRDALRGQLRPPPALLARPARPPHPPHPLAHNRPPPPVLVRQVPLSLMPHNEINENRSNNVGQYILVQRTPNVAPRASSAPPANQNTNVSVSRCRSVGAEEACVCNLRAMVLCKKCGAFCHDDCIGTAELCLTCLIR